MVLYSLRLMKKLLALLFAMGCVLPAQAQNLPPITGIAQVRLYSASQDASKAFYAQTLGLEQGEAGASSIYIINDLQSVKVDALPASEPKSHVEAVVFRTTDAAALAKFLQKQAVAIVQPLEHGTFGVHDPEGNLILFTDSMKNAFQPSARTTSQRMIHAGFVVKDRAAEDHFYHDLLGFHVYWQGGQKDGNLDYVAMQVPNGSDWLEYMLNVPADANAHQLGGSNHISLGLAHMPDAVAMLEHNGCQGANCTKSQLGRDGKIQLNLFDPDLTRVEYMEFTPSQKPCCSPILGKAPSEKEDR